MILKINKGKSIVVTNYLCMVNQDKQYLIFVYKGNTKIDIKYDTEEEATQDLNLVFEHFVDC